LAFARTHRAGVFFFIATGWIFSNDAIMLLIRARFRAGFVGFADAMALSAAKNASYNFRRSVAHWI